MFIIIHRVSGLDKGYKMTKKTQPKKQDTPPKERVLTRDEFMKALKKISRPIPEQKQPKQSGEGKKGTSE